MGWGITCSSLIPTNCDGWGGGASFAPCKAAPSTHNLEASPSSPPITQFAPVTATQAPPAPARRKRHAADDVADGDRAFGLSVRDVDMPASDDGLRAIDAA